MYPKKESNWKPWIMAVAAAAVCVALSVALLEAVGISPAQANNSTPSTTHAVAGFDEIDIDQYLLSERPTKAGTTLMIRPRPVSFRASIKQYPTERKVNYLYEVLQIFPITPEPNVQHRMFLSAPGGQIFPVYVEQGVVDSITKQLSEEGEPVVFLGYHIYTYSKGPAILVTDFREKG